MSNTAPDHLASAGRSEVLLAYPAAVETVVREAAQARQAVAADLRADLTRGDAGARRQGYRIDRGAALIPIVGPLVPYGPVAMSRYGVTSYEGLRDELRCAAADASVSSVLLMIDSPGGYVTGVDATADAILRTRKVKPVVAMVEGMAASAAYWLASQCDEVVVAPLAELGSIGAVLVHVEISRALDASGITVTLIHAGARKIDGNPYEPLSDKARAGLTASLERVRQFFSGSVAIGRGKPQLDVAAVLATEAAMFNARKAVELGLADRIATLDQLLDAPGGPQFVRRGQISASSHLADAFGQGSNAAVPTPQPAAVQPERRSNMATFEDGVERGAAGARAMLGKGPAPGAVAGTSAALTDRQREILDHKHAKGAHRELAAHLAHKTDMSSMASMAVMDSADLDTKREARARGE